jgi:Arc/MetJ-type ribon-helix-helix transcriptional regulator
VSKVEPWFANTGQQSKNTSITLGDYFDRFIQEVLREGRYKNASEVVRAGLKINLENNFHLV